MWSISEQTLPPSMDKLRCIENCDLVYPQTTKPNGNQHPIAFHSRRLRNYEINYTKTELECLAIIDS
ncbi:hypothetical protein TNCV_1241301 [Trichonephila clavipes]|uniref:Reverse transcriptase RNase H-like domain-containing protein n=1 Tax=Trichonephila clavipes TaxID=2585209 RepID=A0A8X6WEF0_TRICX|nr:hypothetical protein TNCV_1241301 [Trichonephila clavipes]